MSGSFPQETAWSIITSTDFKSCECYWHSWGYYFMGWRNIWWLYLVPLLAMGADRVHSQWRIVAPKITNVSHFYGAMIFHDGLLWIANNNILCLSTDTGVSWITKSLPDVDYDIEFYNSLNGLLSGSDAAWITRDGGTSWQSFAPPTASGCFLNDSNGVALAGKYGNSIGITTDGGSSWRNIPVEGSKFYVRYKAGTVYELGGDFPSSLISTSTDFGQTWNQNFSKFDMECYSFAIDSCDQNRIYVIHEDQVNETDPYSKIYLTTNGGRTWQTMVSRPTPFFSGSIAEGTSVIYCQSSSNGVFRSTDRGMTWTSIGGPSITFDTRLIAAINDNIVLALDDDGNVWRTDNSGGDSVTTTQFSSANVLILPSQPATLDQSSCTPADTFVTLGIVGCGSPTGTLDSVWLTGSGAFSLADLRNVPRILSASDSILVSYSGTSGPDTATLHIRYDLGSGARDTIFMVIGTLASRLLSQPEQLHREAASAYFGQLDTLTLDVDVNPSINLDSLWPYLTDIQATYTWDSSVVTYANYLVPSGWSLSSLSNRENALDLEIHKLSASAVQPLCLGTALFQPTNDELATSWVELPRLVIVAGGKTISLCVTDNEDNHWAVKTLGVFNGVDEQGTGGTDAAHETTFEVYPNPVEEELFIRNTLEAPASITIYDAIGRLVLTGTAAAAATSAIDTHALSSGVYFARIACGADISSRVFVKQ